MASWWNDVASTSVWVLLFVHTKRFWEEKVRLLECMDLTSHLTRDTDITVFLFWALRYNIFSWVRQETTTLVPTLTSTLTDSQILVSRSSDCQTINCMKVPPRRLSYFIHTSWKSALQQTLLSGITDSLKRCDGEFGATRGSLRTNRKEQLHEKEYVKVYTENGQMKRIVLISLYKLMFCSKPLVLLTLLELEGKFGWCDLHDAKQVYLPSTLSGKRREKPFM